MSCGAFLSSTDENRRAHGLLPQGAGQTQLL
ncbi:hypothetical protein BW21_1373 [Burkholderia humptydooensis]|nr:hypothetical protein BW21_1373 [Burkholderia sp. 2002721687]